MDTTRRQLLAAIPAVGIASVIGEGQEPAPQNTWEYNGLITSAWMLEDRVDLKLPSELARYGEMGYSVASILPGRSIGTHEGAVVIFKRPTDKRKRVVWEFKSFKLKDEARGPYQQYDALGAEGWEIFYSTPLDGVPKIAHAQRPK